MSSIKDPALTPDLGYFLVIGGDIIDYIINQETLVVEEVLISSGEIRAYSWDGKIIMVPFEVRIADDQGSFGGDKQVIAMVSKELKVKGLLLEKDKFKGPIFFNKDINVKQLPKQAPPAPYISILNESAGIATVEDIEYINVAVRNFNPGLKLEVYLNGELIQLKPEPELDKSGSTKLKIPQMLDIGGHTLLVKQQDGNIILQDVATFVKRVRDDKK